MLRRGRLGVGGRGGGGSATRDGLHGHLRGKLGDDGRRGHAHGKRQGRAEARSSVKGEGLKGKPGGGTEHGVALKVGDEHAPILMAEAPHEDLCVLQAKEHGELEVALGKRGDRGQVGGASASLKRAEDAIDHARADLIVLEGMRTVKEALGADQGNVLRMAAQPRLLRARVNVAKVGGVSRGSAKLRHVGLGAQRDSRHRGSARHDESFAPHQYRVHGAREDKGIVAEGEAEALGDGVAERAQPSRIALLAHELEAELHQGRLLLFLCENELLASSRKKEAVRE